MTIRSADTFLLKTDTMVVSSTNWSQRLFERHNEKQKDNILNTYSQ